MKLVMGLVEIISTRIMWGHENYVLHALSLSLSLSLYIYIYVVAADCLSNAELNTALVWVL
jgi:hypothetical protein